MIFALYLFDSAVSRLDCAAVGWRSFRKLESMWKEYLWLA